MTADSVTDLIDMGPMGQPVQKVTAIAVDGGTQVTWVMDAELGNPIARVIGLSMDGMLGGTLEQGLTSLGQIRAT